MTNIPNGSNYPLTIDSDDNLFLVHDALRVKLAEDYNPGDKKILIYGDNSVFPPNGFITLTEQCSEIDKRAISFYYSSKTEDSFDDLILMAGFPNVIKPKTITNVTQNVMDHHHNALKDALIAIEKFLGVAGTVDSRPYGKTITGRINFLKKLIFTPRAWFSMNKRVGLVPLSVTFSEECYRLGDGDVKFIWDFGDHSVSSISRISRISNVSPSSIKLGYMPTLSAISKVPPYQDIYVRDLNGGTIIKRYSSPGVFDVTLSVINNYGMDVITFEDAVSARIESPNKAVVDVIGKSGQIVSQDPPKIRSMTNTFIDLEIKEGENPNTPGMSYAGEVLDGHKNPIDPISVYTWNLGDDLKHSNSHLAKAAYSVGGIYDIELRVDTQFGAYKITKYDQAIDIIEQKNLWLWTFSNENTDGSGTVRANEFGTTSETFKTGKTNVTIGRSNSFLNYLDHSPYYKNALSRAKKEFSRNVIFANRNTSTSGEGGLGLMFYASGGSNQEIKTLQFNGFSETYEQKPSIPNKHWNWAPLVSNNNVYFLFGENPTHTHNTNLVSPQITTYSLEETSYYTRHVDNHDFSNGADELLNVPSSYSSGIPTNGHFVTYRTAWKDETGYILRNSGVNEFFRLGSFYKTEGTYGNPFVSITRLPDMNGVARVEGELVPMSNGVFFFNNSGDISAYNDQSGVWEKASPTLGTISFRSLQDATVENFNDKANTLLAASDKEHVAYLSYDYSQKAFIKFNNIDLTFNKITSRPFGEQFLMTVY